MEMSVVTTLFCSEDYIQEFYERITKELKQNVESYEIIFVDDGSPDQSLKLAIALSKQDPSVKVVELSKNHGHHRAMMTGLKHTRGSHVFLTDCDLEEVPENFSNFWNTYKSDSDIDVVYGVQTKKNHGAPVRRALSGLFYRVFNFFSYINIPDNELVSRVMSRKYVDTLLSYPESELFIPGVWVDAGFRRVPENATKAFDGQSSYSFRRRISMAVDAITSYSIKPLVYIFYLGTGSSIVSLLVISYLIAQKVIFGFGVDGWASIVASIYLVGSLIIFSIGVVGIYLSRIFSEVKQRPNSIIRNVYIKGKISDK